MMKKILHINIIIVLFILSVLGFYISESFKYLYDIYSIYILIYLSLFKKSKFKLDIDKYQLIYFIIFICIMIISVISNISNRDACIDFIRIFIAVILIYKILAVYGENYIYNFLNQFIFLMFIINIFGIFEFITRINIFQNFALEGYKSWFSDSVTVVNFRSFSIFIHPIIYGTILSINLICLINLKSSMKKIFYFLNLILIVINIYGTKSRSSWIAISIVFIIYIIFKIKKINNIKLTKKNFLYSYIILILSFILIIIFRNGINNIFESIINRFTYNFFNDVSRIQRISTINLILKNSIKNPFYIIMGHGFKTVGTFMLNNKIIISGFTSTDNQYMTFIYEFGYIFLIIYILFLLKTFINIFKSKNKLQLLFCIIFIDISINMFFYEAFGWKDVLLWLILSLILSSTIKFKRIKGSCKS